MLPVPSFRRASIVLAVAAAVTACGSEATPPAPPSNDMPASPTPASPAETVGLVGTWRRENTCQELVSALRDAVLDRWVLEFVAGNGFIPGVEAADQIADPKDPCAGAVPREHSHFFTEDGAFGSLDWNGDPVDDGRYEVPEDGTLVISKEFPDVTFHYAINGDTIMFEPEIPSCSPDCFEAAWSVSVAMPGETWQRTA
jgi:hypothetical protein